MKVKEVTWNDIYKRINKLDKNLKYYGIPRGGQIIAGLTGKAVDSVKNCDVIIDDIYDSGKTAKAWANQYDKKLIFLYDKRKEDLPWIVFPWEKTFNNSFFSFLFPLNKKGKVYFLFKASFSFTSFCPKIFSCSFLLIFEI